MFSDCVGKQTRRGIAKMIFRHTSSSTLVILAVTAVATFSRCEPSWLQAQDLALRYAIDPAWPKLPQDWVMGGVGGTCVDTRDHVLILNRQNVSEQDLKGRVLAPAVIEVDTDGNVVNSWGNPKTLVKRLHDCQFDDDNNVWIVGVDSGFIQKYSHDGSRLLAQLGKADLVDSTDGTVKGGPLNSDRAQFFTPSGIDIDSTNGDIYIADGHSPGGNYRIAVFRRDGDFIRQWQLNRTGPETNIQPSPHCIGLTRDELVYVCDRWAYRVQVFDKVGRFKRNIPISSKIAAPRDPQNTEGGSVALDFSRDPDQKLMYVINSDTGQIDIFDRHSGRVVSRFGEGPGSNAGQLTGAHGIAVDSKGNVYVAEQQGKRIQKFKLVN